MERFATLAAQAFNRAIPVDPAAGILAPLSAADLEVPPDPTFGDFGVPCFRFAKPMRLAPPQIAKNFAEKIEKNGNLDPSIRVSAVGPYVNFTVNAKNLATALLGDLAIPAAPGLPPKRYGSLPASSRGAWVMEFSSPNVAKPLNIYHLRTTALGAALNKIGRYRGFKMISINHLGDWGKQYGLLSVAFKKYGISIDTPITMPELVDLYVRINKDAEQDPSLNEQAKQAFLALEKGEPEVTKLWKKCVDISIQEFDRVYRRIDVEFDHIWGESYYQNQLESLISRLRSSGLMIESEGAWVVPVEGPDGKELPPCIIQKSDGATIYATRDLAAAIYRHEKFNFDRMTYIVGSEQKLHFVQVFGVLKKMGFAWQAKCEHVPTGLYRFKDAKMSTRKGNFVTLEQVLDEAKQRVLTIMQSRDPLPNAEEVAEKIAVGAVVFFDLHSDPVRDVEFDLERVVDFEGETGPYLQYAHTRCLSTQRRADQEGLTLEAARKAFTDGELDFSTLLATKEEQALLRALGQFPIQLERTLKFSKASQLAHYLVEIAHAFGAFYRECRVLGEKREVSLARLLLMDATRNVLATGLELIGVPLPDRM